LNRIRLLPEQVANQIAAGEVVERPASVVKELVENALDAGARRIVVEIGAGGRSLVRVTDDGAGMSRDDALMCLERHATSKLQRAEDLTAISTMGFRGEAIPSIASVSRFTLVTRERLEGEGEATRVIVHGGRVLEARAAAGPPGTMVEVRQLFYNLPARRKFLRTEPTERAHIQHTLTLAAIANPEVAFVFSIDGRTEWELPAASGGNPMATLAERLRQLRGEAAPTVAVDFKGAWRETIATDADAPPDTAPAVQRSELRLWGFIGAPGVSRATRDEQHVFVNRRPVEHRGLNFALQEGCHHSLMKGRHPVCCLFLEIDPAAVDVNVHPQKREVRFRDEAGVRRAVADAVRRALEAHHNPAPQTQPVSTDNPALHAPVTPAAVLGRQLWLTSPTGPAPATTTPSPSAPAARTAEVSKPAVATPPGLEPAPAATDPDSQPSHPTTAPAHQDPPPVVAAPGPATPLLSVPLRIVGVVGRLYVVLESDRGVVLMDQHAAHERVLYEESLQRLETGGPAPSQKLLLPETVELGPRDADFLRRHLDVLARLGVGLREFGERTFLLDGLPPFVKASDPRRFTLDLVDQLRAAGAGVNSFRLGEDAVAKTVCRHAIKANDPLAGPELEALLHSLRRCVMPYTCPHGRPTLIEMNWRDLERRFGRTA
jgi:DNA mismatch repair protein MutL